MSERIGGSERRRDIAKEKEARNQGFQGCRIQAIAASEGSGASVSEPVLKESIMDALGFPRGTMLSELNSKLPIDHYWRPHFRAIGSVFLFKEPILAEALQKTADRFRGSKREDLREAAGKIELYARKLEQKSVTRPHD